MLSGPTSIPWTAWAAHAYTASGAVLAFLSARATVEDDFPSAFLWLFLAVIVDSTDGWLARFARVHARTPQFSGEKLDDIVDYLTFVFVPALIVWRAHLVPDEWLLVVVGAMLVSSGYGFANADAKTEDHFFTGFPSYWNIAVFYLFAWRLRTGWNVAILLALAALVFVRFKYIYPSRTPHWRVLTVTLCGLWGALLLVIVVRLPLESRLLLWLSMIFPVYYVGLSLVLSKR